MDEEGSTASTSSTTTTISSSRTSTINHHHQRRLMMMMMMLAVLITASSRVKMVEALWCVARSDASEEALQKGLDYACAAGADCAPILDKGLCFLPNTLEAHASYAFNSYYQRSHMAPGSCDFSGTATLAKTDPSYGSCVYPASPSTAGGITSTTGTTTGGGAFGNTTPMTPTTTSPTTLDGGAGLNPNTMGPPISTTTDSKASDLRTSPSNTGLLGMSLFLILLVAFF